MRAWQMVWALAAMTLLSCGGSDLEKATRASQAEGDRPLVIMATASWCGPCRHFKTYVLPSPQVQEALRDVQFVMLDEGRSAGSIRRLGVRSFPTFLVVRPDQSVVAGLRGSVSASKFIDFLQWGTPNWFTRTMVTEQLAERPSTRTRVYAARWHALHGELPRAGELYREALANLGASEEDRRPALTWEATLVGSAGMSSADFARQAVAFIDRFPTANQVESACQLALVSGGLDSEQARALALRAVDLLRDNAQALNGLVYDLIAVDLAEVALIAAQRQVALTPANANAYDTLAEAHNALGQRDQALAAVGKALSLETASDSRATYQANRRRYATGAPLPGLADKRAERAQPLARYHIGGAR